MQGTVVDSAVTAASSTSVPRSDSTDVHTSALATEGATMIDGLVIADAVTSNGFSKVHVAPVSNVHVVAVGDGFVRLHHDGNDVVVSSGIDGRTWQSVESDLGVASIQDVVSDGQRIVAIAYESAGERQPTPWLSIDEGRSWVELPLPEPEPAASEFVTSIVGIDDLAVTADRIVIAGRDTMFVDWREYSMTVLHEDHGDPMGEGASSGSLIVFFADGFELTVDPASLGLSAPTLSYTPVILVHDGDEWIRTTQTESTEGGPYGVQIAAGPGGFVWLARSAALSNAVRPLEAFVSTDGERWTAHSLPGDFGQHGALVGGPLGYVAISTTALYHSPDGVEWTKVHTFEDLDDDTTISPPADNPAAGVGGFIIPIRDNLDTTPTLRLFGSRDGKVWTEQRLRDGIQGVEAAVSNLFALVVPIVAGDPADAMLDLPDDDAELAELLAYAYAVDRPWMSDADAQCISDGLIDALGVDRIREFPVMQYPFRLLGYGLSYQIGSNDAQSMVEVFRRCSADWELLMITTITSGTEFIGEESARCVALALDDGVSEQIFVLELDRPYDDAPSPAGPDLSHLEPMMASLEECLTDQELNAIDFD
jgi:hypothetical protein